MLPYCLLPASRKRLGVTKPAAWSDGARIGASLTSSGRDDVHSFGGRAITCRSPSGGQTPGTGAMGAHAGITRARRALINGQFCAQGEIGQNGHR